MFKLSIAALAAAASLLVAAPALAGVVLDQSDIPETGHTPFGGGSSYQLGPNGVAQTFTVGVTGILDHVAFDVEAWTFLGAPADLRFQLLDGAFNAILTRDIAAAAVPVFGFSGFDWANTLNVDLRAAGIAVQAGDHLALKVSSLSGYSGLVIRTAYESQSIQYAGGAAYSYDVPPGFTPPIVLGADFGFRTYVAVPEPATWGLMIVGFAGLGSVLRRRPAAA